MTRKQTLKKVINKYLDKEAYLKKGLQKVILIGIAEGKKMEDEPYYCAVVLLTYGDKENVFLPFVQYGRGYPWKFAESNSWQEHFALYALMNSFAGNIEKETLERIFNDGNTQSRRSSHFR